MSQTPGDPKYELLRNPGVQLYEDLVQYGLGRFTMSEDTFWQAFPHYKHAIYTMRKKAGDAQARRAEMPVIEEQDLDGLRFFLSTPGMARIFCDECTTRWSLLRPLQCQIYLDKCVDGTAQYGVKGTREFLESNHIIITEDDHILDGHHRWATGMMMAPGMVVPAFRIGGTVEDLLAAMREFSRQMGHEPNA